MIRATAFSAAVLGAGVFMATVLPASAQSTFDRFESVAVTMNGMIFDAMIDDLPALEGEMPSAEWSDDLRTAYTCMFDQYIAEAGEPAVSDMVTAMEATLETATPADILAGGGAVENPEGITDEQALEIVGGCGMMEAFVTHMASTDALQIMMEQ